MTARLAGRVYDEALAPAKLNATQYAILVNIHRYQPIEQVTLATHLELERTTLYRVVDVLERRKLLVRVAARGASSRKLKLTPAGTMRVASAQHLWRAAQMSLISSFGASAWAALSHTLTELRGKMKAKLPGV